MILLNKILNFTAHILFALSIYLSSIDKYPMLSSLLVILAVALILYTQGKRSDKL